MSSSYKISDIAKKVTSGGTPSSTNSAYYGGEIPWLRTQEVNFNRIYSTDISITEEGLKKSPAKLIPKNSVIVAMYGATAGKVAINKIDLSTNQACCNIIVDENKADYEYIYYSLKNDYKKLLGLAIGAAQQNLSTGLISNYEINLPDIQKQKKVSRILGDLDAKIELNRKMNKTLEEMGQALFKHYFVDNPESKNWKRSTFGDISINFDSKRIPLSSSERAKRKGFFRYYGATSVMDYVNDYLFDGRFLLVAEDGSVLNEDNTPILQYVWGKFWVNNHAHVLQAKEGFSVEYLYLLLRRQNVLAMVSGAVQLKINQKALNSLEVLTPSDEVLRQFHLVIEPMFTKIRNNSEQIDKLSLLRDSLLPRLLSGKTEL